MTDPQTDTSLWRLYLRLGHNRLSALMTGPESVEQSVRFSSVELPAAPSPLQALEEAVYSTPMLPSDFASVAVMIDTKAFTLTPPLPSAPAEAAVRALMPDATMADEAVLCTPFGLSGDVALTMLHPATEMNFLRRTFANPRFSHPLAATGQYLSHTNASAGDPRRSYAILTADTLLMLCFGPAGRLLFANRFAISSADDAAYYILATLPTDSPLMIGGPNELRNTVAETLRRYVDPVLPLTLAPNLLHLLSAAPEAPLDLLMLTQII